MDKESADIWDDCEENSPSPLRILGGFSIIDSN